MYRTSILFLISALISLAGCARFDGIAVRQEQASSFKEDIESRTNEALGEGNVISLEKCIGLALEYNQKVRSSDLVSRIAKLDRQTAFASFLPAVDMNYTSTELDRAPSSSMLGPFSVPVQDRIVRETKVRAQMPIFAPATWFMYAAYTRGEEIADIASEYTRQMIALQVSGLFFQCLALEEAGKSLDSQREAATARIKDIDAFFKEGLAMESQTLQAHTLLLARETDCAKNSRALDEAKVNLLQAMGLSPLAKIQLQQDTMIAEPEGGLEDWILATLLNNPRLAIADRQVAIEQEKIRIAITEFLPILAVFAGRSHTTNSLLTFPYTTAFGFSGLMTLFNGFANINEYKAARANQEKAFVAREEESLALMAEVLRARLNLEDARSDRALAESALTAATAVLREAEARLHEGLMNTSEVLDAAAGRDNAVAHVAGAKFQEQMAVAVLRNVIGETYRGEEVK